MPQYNSEFGFGDKVQIDGGDITATVVGFAVYPHGLQILVSWWKDAELKETWVHNFRLKKVGTS